MATQNDTIELNGYKYDARTGARLGRADRGNMPSKAGSMDGFAPTRTAPEKPATQKTPTPSHAVHSKVSKSKTLRRQGLKKPRLAAPQMDIAPPKPIEKRTMQPDQARVSRAAQAQKHPHVSKFQPRTTHRPMEPKPAPPETPSPQDTAAKSQETKRSVLPLSPFDMALQRADSHNQPPPSKLTFRERVSKKLRISPRTLSAGLGVLLVLSIGGFLARQHLSTLAVQLAATRAGVEAKLPGYEPAGFSLAGPVEYSAGQIALSYQSNSDDRNFKIVQKNSEWNSQALLENFVEASDEPFQTVQDKGKTIYIYGDNNATWVSGGVWFQVEGESSLNTDQLLRIASGL